MLPEALRYHLFAHRTRLKYDCAVESVVHLMYTSIAKQQRIGRAKNSIIDHPGMFGVHQRLKAFAHKHP